MLCEGFSYVTQLTIIIVCDFFLKFLIILLANLATSWPADLAVKCRVATLVFIHWKGSDLFVYIPRLYVLHVMSAMILTPIALLLTFASCNHGVRQLLQYLYHTPPSQGHPAGHPASPRSSHRRVFSAGSHLFRGLQTGDIV